MIRLIKFAAGPVARFTITPEIIAQIPGIDDMVLQFGNKKFETLPVEWPRFDRDFQEAQDLGVENWNLLVNKYISSNLDLQDTKLIIIARFAPYVLESRSLYLERYKAPDVYGSLSRHLKIYCPISVAGRKNKEQFERWIIV